MLFRSSLLVLGLLVVFTGCAPDPTAGAGSSRAVVLACGCIAFVLWQLAISYYVAREPVVGGTNRQFTAMGMKPGHMERQHDHVAFAAHQNRIAKRQNRPSDGTSRCDPWRTLVDNATPQKSTSTILKDET